MKKIMSLIVLFFFTLVLSSCSNDGNNQGLISLLMPSLENNSCVEIYNFSDDDMDLSKYKIAIYGKPTSKEATKVISLSGKISPKKCYVISNDKASSDIQILSDVSTSEFVIGGLEAVALMLNNKVVDVVGYIGTRNMLADKTMVRKVWIDTPSTEYDPYNFLVYGKESLLCLGKFYNTVTEEELLAGPKFDKATLNIPFFNPETPKNGTGGAVEVTLHSNIDGDTSRFYFTNNIEDYLESSQISYSGGKKYCKVRYCYVDTAETMSHMIQEWGWPAKKNTADLQTSADHIYVQTENGGALADMGYGRLMGFVFVEKDGDTKMVNFDTIIKGYSEASFVLNDKMCYKGLPYYGYFINAQEYAKRNNKGRYGEKDPYWDYTNNKSIYA